VARALAMAAAGGGASLSAGEFLRAHGALGLFTQGAPVELSKATTSRVLKFSLYPVLRERLGGPDTAARRAAAGVLLILPLEVGKLALQLDTANVHCNSLASAAGQLAQERGPAALWTGLPAVWARQAVWTAAYFATLPLFEDALRRAGVERTASRAAAGFCAGVSGTVLNTPFDVCRSLVQKGALQGAPLSLVQAARSARAAGGLWAGLGPKALHLGGGGMLMAVLLPAYTRLHAPAAARSKGLGAAFVAARPVLGGSHRRRSARRRRAAASGDNGENGPATVEVCINKDCAKRGSRFVAVGFRMMGATVAEIGCLGNCGEGPNIRVAGNKRVLPGVKRAPTMAALLAAFGPPGPAVAAATVAEVQEMLD